MTTAPVFEGVPIKLGGVDYVLPPMNIDALEKYMPVVESWAQPSDLPPMQGVMKQVRDVAEMIHAALQLNYPDLSLAEVRASLNLKNANSMLHQLLEVSGLARTESGEASAGGAPTGDISGQESVL